MSKVKDSVVTDLVVTQGFNAEALIEKAVAGNASIEVLERLFALSKEVRAEQAKAAWHSAMAAFQRDVPAITKSKVAKVRTTSGGEYSYSYAPLEEIISVIRPKLAEQGLSVTFTIESHSDVMIATCLVAHELGHVQPCTFAMPVDLNSRMSPAQQVASATTYARRYAYLSALGLCPEDDDDDDGNAAGDGREHNSASRARPSGGTSNPKETSGPSSRGNEPANRPQVPRESPAPAGVGPMTWTGKLVKREEKPSENGSVRYVFHAQDGMKFATFSKTIADGLFALDGHFVRIDGEQNRYGVKISSFADANEQEVPV